MDDFKTYILEELKQSDDKMKKLNDIQLNLIKFYFTTFFSLATVTVALINYKIYDKADVLITWFLLLPLFIFGIVVFSVLKILLFEYENLEHTRNQVSEIFLHGSIKNDYKVRQSPFKPFYTLISWIIIFNFVFLIYGAIPFFRKMNLSTFVIVVIVLLLAFIIFTIFVLALNNARAKSRDARRISDIKQVQTALELYYNDKGKYPTVNSWADLAIELRKKPTYMSNTPLDPLNKEDSMYSYKSSEDGQHYTIDFKLEEKGKFEATPEGINIKKL